MALNVAGLVAILLFYALILGVGIYAAWRRRSKKDNSDEIILAGRSIGPFVGLMTMTATWVGGGYINGTAEATFTQGLLYCQAPFGYAVSLVLGGLFFAKKMREAEYKTMLDPLQESYGQRWGCALYLPALFGETLWTASILDALGSTLSVILDLPDAISIVVSASIAVLYTLVGGLYSVAYTDVVQLFCIAIGLWLAVPFSLHSEYSGSLNPNTTNWLGEPPNNPYEWGTWWDYAFLLVFGGIPWQVYFQRVLSAKTSRQAQILSYGAAIGCFVMAIPAVLIGAIAKTVEWEQTPFNQSIVEAGKAKLVLPLVLQYLTPSWVAFIGLGAVSAAVMSSADSSVLSASSMFTHNVYKGVIRPHASIREMNIVLRLAIPVVTAVACAIAIFTTSIYAL
ncbi:high-affinity choline transporter 1-like, partial [Hyalella azteca]|uniref:High-affinity choline transporter 1-like n=1 Tax=Hyalella azteca TaxID=294128 RepID=A0A8B7N6H1_HYAAZ